MKKKSLLIIAVCSLFASESEGGICFSSAGKVASGTSVSGYPEKSEGVRAEPASVAIKIVVPTETAHPSVLLTHAAPPAVIGIRTSEVTFSAVPTEVSHSSVLLTRAAPSAVAVAVEVISKTDDEEEMKGIGPSQRYKMIYKHLPIPPRVFMVTAFMDSSNMLNALLKRSIAVSDKKEQKFCLKKARLGLCRLQYLVLPTIYEKYRTKFVWTSDFSSNDADLLKELFVVMFRLVQLPVPSAADLMEKNLIVRTLFKIVRGGNRKYYDPDEDDQYLLIPELNFLFLDMVVNHCYHPRV